MQPVASACLPCFFVYSLLVAPIGDRLPQVLAGCFFFLFLSASVSVAYLFLFLLAGCSLGVCFGFLFLVQLL